MLLKSVSDGRITGTGTLEFESRILGGVLISADGTNAAVVTVQADNSSGATVFSLSSESPIFVAGPIAIGSSAGYYSITGTGGAAQLYEWVE